VDYGVLVWYEVVPPVSSLTRVTETIYNINAPTYSARKN